MQTKSLLKWWRASRTILGSLLYICFASSAWGQASVTLSPTTSPAAAQPGVTSVTILGSGFPAGTISPSSVTVTFQAKTTGGGPSGVTTATSVTTVLGTSRRVGFVIPTTLSVTAPTPYQVTISGTTTTGAAFQSSDAASLTVDPAASIVSVTPNTGQAGQTISITLTGNFTNFLAGSTMASFGAGIAVAGAAEGSFGNATVIGATSLTAQLTIDPAASAGPRTVRVQTGIQAASLVAGFSVTPPANLPPPVASPGGPYTGVVNQTVSFNGSRSSNPTGTPLTYLWFFGDGTSDSSGPTPTHIYASPGTYPVTLTVSDPQREAACGAVNTLSKCLMLDTGSGVTQAQINLTSNTTPPTVTITSPASLALLNQHSVTVVGTVKDPNYPNVPVIVNGVSATVSGNTFQASSVPLREGDNLLTATSTDPAGNVGSASLTVVVDTTPPNIQINWPANNAILSSASVDVAGIVNDAVSGTVNAAQVNVTVNGSPTTVSNRSFFFPSLPLNAGLNTITAVATDRAGNTSQAQIQVYRQTSSQPQLTVVSGDNQSGVAGVPLANLLVVQLSDATGKPLAVRPITFSVTKSDGQLIGFGTTGQKVVVSTNAAGQASISFQLGSRAGVGINQVVATYAGSTMSAVFLETSTPGSPGQIHVVSGINQVGIAGSALALPLIALITDNGGNPISGVNVTFTVTQGGGTLNGNSSDTQTTDSDGKVRDILVLGQQEGINNNSVSADFAGDTGIPAIFSASGVVPGDPAATQVSGVVYDNAGVPVPNATATIVGTSLSAVSNTQGFFAIPGAPVGAITLMVDGRTSTRPETFPFLSFNLTTIAGQNNTIGMPVLLPPLDVTNAQTVGGSQNVVLTMVGVPGVQLTVFANSVTFPDGSHVGLVGLSQVHADKVPMQPANGTAPLLVGTLQPAGVRFNPPIQVQYPNINGLAPGTVVDIFSFDHDLEEFISQGPARVSADGSVIVSDPGFGITKSGWTYPAPPDLPPVCVDPPSECMKVNRQTCRQVPDPSKDGNACKGPYPLSVPGSDTKAGNSVIFNDTRFASAGTGENKLFFVIDASCFGQCLNGACVPSKAGFSVAGIEFGLDDALTPIYDPGENCIGGGFRNLMQYDALNVYAPTGGPGLQILCDSTPPADQQTTAFIPFDNDVLLGGKGGHIVTLTTLSLTGPSIGNPPIQTVDSSVLFHEMVHAFGNDPGTLHHNDWESAGYPPITTTDADLNAEFATDRPYGCQQACFEVGNGNPKACGP